MQTQSLTPPLDGPPQVTPLVSDADGAAGLVLVPASGTVTITDTPALNVHFSQVRTRLSAPCCVQRRCSYTGLVGGGGGGGGRVQSSLTVKGRVLCLETACNVAHTVTITHTTLGVKLTATVNVDGMSTTRGPPTHPHSHPRAPHTTPLAC